MATPQENYRDSFNSYAKTAHTEIEQHDPGHRQEVDEIFNRVGIFLLDRPHIPIELVNPLHREEGPDVDFEGVRIPLNPNDTVHDFIEFGVEVEQNPVVGQGHSGRMVMIGIDGWTLDRKPFHHQFIIHHGKAGFMRDSFTTVAYSYEDSPHGWERIDTKNGIPQHDTYLNQALSAAGVPQAES